MTLLIGILLAAGTLAAQDQRRTVEAREFTLKIESRENPVRRTLWISQNSGKEWAKAPGASWSDWADGFIRCTVRVPEDGNYDFYAQLGDDLSNQAPEPKPGEPARADMRFAVQATPSGGIRIVSPRGGREFIGGNQAILRWEASAEGLRDKSVHLYAQVGDAPWKIIDSNLPLKGEVRWTLPAAKERAALRFRVEASTAAGGKVTGKDVVGTLVSGRTTAGLVWESPAAPEDWVGGRQVTLRWNAAGPEFRERSSRLQYRIGEDGPWMTITRGLEPTGTYLWVVPNRETSALRLRVSAITRGNRESAAVTEPLSVRKTERADVARARALYDRARVLHAQARYAEAELKYQEALEAWSEFGEVYNDMGKLHAEQRRPAKALEYFLRARKICPSNPVPYVNAAFADVRLGLLDDAVAEIRDAVELGLEKDARTSVLAGEVLWRIASRSMKKDQMNPTRARDAAALILKIRRAAPDTRTRAEKLLLRLAAE